MTRSECSLLLELDGEPIVLELRCQANDIPTKAGRLAAWLSAQGWQQSPIFDQSECDCEV
jgi:hypothetical protein